MMIALIRKNDTEVYPSVVFAEFLDGLKSKIIVFDPEYKDLIYVNFWEGQRDFFGNFLKDYFGNPRKIYRNVFIIDTDKSDWDTAKGYSWLLEDKNALKAIQKGKEIYPGTIRKCLELQGAVSIPEWRELTCEKDVDDIMECSYNFHNASIVNVAREDGQIYLEFDIDGGCRVLMRIPEEGSELNIDEPWDEEQVGEKWQSVPFFEASIFYRDGYIYWVDCADVGPDDEIPEDEDASWFKATKMEWKLIINPLK